MRRSIVGLGIVIAGCGPHNGAPPPPKAPVATPQPPPVAPAPPVHPTAAAKARAELEPALAFEGMAAGVAPTRWKVLPEGAALVDAAQVHGGHGALRMERTPATERTFSVISSGLPIDFAGATVELHGFLRTEDVQGIAGLWLREDGEDKTVQFDNMADKKLDGTHAWTEFSVALPIDPAAKSLVFGVLLAGTGKVWADDLRLLVDGKPLWDAPFAPRPTVPSEPADHAFDAGSGISVAQLSPVQIGNLALLGEVWGFLKYHHPAVTAGKLRWDAQLLHALPAILAATDRAAAEAALVAWIDTLPPLAPCKPCAQLDDTDLVVRPDTAWQATVGTDLAGKLRAIAAARVPDQQFYLSLGEGAGNPVFEHESLYPAIQLPDPGYQLLGLFRLWNAVAYWAPDRELADHWSEQLARAIPTVMLAPDRDAYALALIGLIAKIRDTHANLWSSLDVRPPVGKCALDLDIRFLGKRAVVAAAPVTANGKLLAGDAIASIDGVAVDKLVAAWLPFYASSNEAAQRRDIATSMTRGACGPIALGIERRGAKLRVELARTEMTDTFRTHDLPGPAFRMLAPDVAYLKLSSVVAADVPKQIQQAAGTKGLVVDIRNYPSEFVVFALGQLFVDRPTPFVKFTHVDLSNPGATHWTAPTALEPAAPHYAGKIVVLVDEASQSQAEYTTMAFRAAHAVVIGSTTAGADGNVSAIPLPGGLQTMISGLGVFYPDGKPTQQIGILPDVVVRPTVDGLRAGRDEVLEAGLRAILGKATPAATLQKIVRDARSTGAHPPQ